MEIPKSNVFEEHVAEYEAWFDAHPHAFASELEAVRELLPEAGAGLEIGVGTGRFASPLGIRLGVEPAAAMRAVAEKRGIEAIDAVAESLPFYPETFDYVLMVTTVCFLSDIKQSFREAGRVLKPGGAFLAGIIDRNSPLGQQYERHKDESVFYEQAHFHSVEEVAALLREAGFEDLAFRQTLFGDPADMATPDEVLDGYGEGAFVVIRGMKREK